MRAVEASLKRLRTDWIDLYQVHRPDPADADRGNPARARRSGARRARCARSAARTFPPPQLDCRAGRGAARELAALRHLPGRIQPAGARHRARPRSRAMRRAGMSLLPYLPLASGLPDRQVPARRAAAAGRAARLQPRTTPPTSSTSATGRMVEKLQRVSRRAPAIQHAGTGLRLAAGEARHRQRHRRRHHARAGRAERRRRGASALAGRSSPKSTRITRNEQTKPRALIIGGSVGGLFAANLLRSIGWDAVVFERNPEELTGRGAGISTHPQLHDVTRRLGIPFDDSMGIRVDSVVFLDHDGRDLRPARHRPR